MRGYIKLYRQIADNPIWRIKPFSEGQAWVDMLCITSYEKGFIKTKNGEIISLECGDCGYSVLTLSERWGWSRGKVKRFLNLLETQKMIQQKMHGKLTVVSILNFGKYQNRTTNDTTNDTTNGQQTDTIKKEKNDKNEKKERNITIFSQNPDLMFDDNINKVFDLYRDNCPDLVPLKFETRDLELRQAIKDFLIFIDFDFSYFFELCQKANKQRLLLDNKIDIKSLVKNHTRIYSGFYNAQSANSAESEKERCNQERENRIRELEEEWKNGKDNRR